MDDFETKVRQIAQDVHDNNSTSDQFAVSQTPFHSHNGRDSQQFPFINLSDVPNSYFPNKISAAGYTVSVNATATGLVFIPPSTFTPIIGTIVSGGTAGTPFPSGWTVTNLSTGQYKVLHTLGNANFIVLSQVFGSNERSYIVSNSSTQFIVEVVDSTGAFANAGVWFQVITY